jgi:hypothetical protein
MVWSECSAHEVKAKSLLVASNALYLFGPLVLWLRRRYNKETWVPSDHTYAAATLGVFVISSLYHLCDASSNETKCAKYCVNSFLSLYHADMIASAFVVHASLLVGWNTKSSFEVMYVAWSSVLFPYIALNMIGLYEQYELYLCFVSIVAFFDAAVRLGAQGWFINNHITLVLVAVSVLLGVLCQYFRSELFGALGYYETHTVWHFATGVAVLAVPFVFKSTTKRVEKAVSL